MKSLVLVRCIHTECIFWSVFSSRLCNNYGYVVTKLDINFDIRILPGNFILGVCVNTILPMATLSKNIL